MKCAP